MFTLPPIIETVNFEKDFDHNKNDDHPFQARGVTSFEVVSQNFGQFAAGVQFGIENLREKRPKHQTTKPLCATGIS